MLIFFALDAEMVSRSDSSRKTDSSLRGNQARILSGFTEKLKKARDLL